MDREDFQWKNKEHILELEQFQGKKGQGLPLLYFPLLLAHTGVKNLPPERVDAAPECFRV